MKGIPTSGPIFFQCLVTDDKFCAELGRAVLAAGRLESALKQYLAKNVTDVKLTKLTLGKMIKFAEKNSLLIKMIPALSVIIEQRNYFSHNIHSLLFGLIEETIFESSELLDSDVITYTEYAWQLKENLNGLSSILEKLNSK